MQDDNTPDGTIIVKAVEDSLDMYISEGLTKANVMQILIEALHGIDAVDIGMDEIMPEGALGGGKMLQ